MEFGHESPIKLHWRNSPDLMLDQESLVEVISALRTKVHTLETNELLSGTTLPPWLIQALTEVASNVDTVVECRTLKEQVASLQKEILELRHELLIKKSQGNSYTPTPTHKMATAGARQKTLSSLHASNPAPSSMSTSSGGLNSDVITSTAAQAEFTTQANFEAALKPLWEVIHKQTNDFANLREDFREAKDTVVRLQSELKRRDALLQARNTKHESVIQSQVEKINDALRECISRSELISAEQRLTQQMKQDREHVEALVNANANKLTDDLLKVRAEQEDINSMSAETVQLFTRKVTKMEDQSKVILQKQQESDYIAQEINQTLSQAFEKIETGSSDLNNLLEKIKSFEETQTIVNKLSNQFKKHFAENELLRDQLEEKLQETISDTARMIRMEIAIVNNSVTELVSLNLDSEIKILNDKMEMMTSNLKDCIKELGIFQTKTTTKEEENKNKFAQAFDTIEKILQNISILSEENDKISIQLQSNCEQTTTFLHQMDRLRETTNQSLTCCLQKNDELNVEVEKATKSFENEVSSLKKQLFVFENTNSNLKKEIEKTQQENQNFFKNFREETNKLKLSAENLFGAKNDLCQRLEVTENQMLTFHQETRNEITNATNKLVAIVDKESERVEALYASFAEKQEQFKEVVARSSVRNMELNDMTKELDKLSDIYVHECWKFETSARTSSNSKATTSHQENNTTNNSMNNNNYYTTNSQTITRKLFNERQQQILTRNTQFFADIIVARAEYEILHFGCNKEVKNQNDLEILMIESQARLLEKLKNKIHTKIMNNKNIGEQFDKSALDRRELYIETINNMLDAALKRRTLGFDIQEKRSNISDIFTNDDPTSVPSCVESQKLVAVGAVRRKNTYRERERDRKLSTTTTTPLAASGVRVTPSTSSDLETSHEAVASTGAFVYRAGFRIRKGGSPPSSPAMSTSRKAANGPLDIETLSTSVSQPAENLAGWESTDDQKEQENEGHMTKSYSLPALSQRSS